MPFGLWAQIGTRNRWKFRSLVQRSKFEGGGKRQHIVNYRDLLLWAVQKRLNRSRRHLCDRLGWAQPGECNWTVHVRRRCGLFIKLLKPLVKKKKNNYKRNNANHGSYLPNFILSWSNNWFVRQRKLQPLCWLSNDNWPKRKLTFHLFTHHMMQLHAKISHDFCRTNITSVAVINHLIYTENIPVSHQTNEHRLILCNYIEISEMH